MDDLLISRAFDVEDVSEDFDPSVPPSTGLEYLQHVMYEASKCAQVVVADIDKKKIKNEVNVKLEPCAPANIKFLAPPVEWENTQVALFSDLRKKVELARKFAKFKPLSLPSAQSSDKWFGVCFGEKNQRLEPSLTVLLSMNEPLLERVLEYQLEWLEEGLRPDQGKWIYALLACLSLPLTPFVCSVLRDLARLCANIISTKHSLGEKDVTILNLIICLVITYFRQIDLAHLKSVTTNS